MEFIINPAVYAHMFPIPNILVDENIKMASTIQLRVIMYFYRHAAMGETVTNEQIAKAIGKDVEDVEDAMLYWLDRGLLLKNGETVNFVPEPSESEQPKPQQEVKPQAETKTAEKKKVSDLPILRPSHEQIAIRCNECSQFRDLFSEAQQKLGKTIGYDGQSILIMLHDSYGLPVEVILMLLEYAVSQGKNSFRYIANLGKKWSESEIDTYEAAEQYIQLQSGVNGLWKEFRELTGVKNAEPTTKQRRFFTAWKNEYGFDAQMIYLAYEISIDNTEKMSLSYMDKVLKSWHEKGIKTPIDVGNEQRQWEDNRKKASQKASKKESTGSNDNASYDLDAFTKKSIGLKYKKNSD